MSEKLNKYQTPLKIGALEFPTRVLSAPMAGITNREYRDFLRAVGCKFLYTEMVNAEGLIRSPRKARGHVGIDGEMPPVGVQIYGKTPEALAKAAMISESYGAALIDLNLGCPAKKVVRNEAGSALLAQPTLLKTIFAQIRQAIKIPFTIKMRSGIGNNPKAAFEIAKIAEGEGVDAICLHPRTREDFYKGHSDWSQIAEMKSIVKIPVIGNGDIRDPEDAIRMVEETDCDAVMIGRGAMGNPWLFKNTSLVLEQNFPINQITEIKSDELVKIIHMHYQFTMKGKDEIKALREMRKFVIHYFRGFSGAKEFRNRWMSAETFSEIESLLKEVDEHLKY